jgi:RNA polymerase sigma-70 factor (ECF subfamily)
VSFLPENEDTAALESLAIFKKHLGFVPKIFRAQMARADLVESEAKLMETLLFTTHSLTRIQKEVILLAVSAANLNTYFVGLQTQVLQLLGIKAEDSDRIAIGQDGTSLSEADQALLDFARKLALHARSFSAADVEVLRRYEFTDQQILEAIVLIGFAHFLNAVQMGLGIKPDFKPRLVFPLEKANPAIDSQRPMLELPLVDESAIADPDADIVARVNAGDTDLFEELVRRHGRRIYRSLLAIVGSTAEAEDAMQDAFLKAFEHLAEFKGRSKFSTWLVRIAINTGLQRLRGRKDFESLDEDEEEFRPRRIQAWQDDPEASYSREELRQLIEKEIMKLPLKYRVPLMLRDLEELSTEEAANALGLTISGLKARVVRGRLMLRESLVPYFSSEGTRVSV